jgi:pimeloyl-ACP methyl ester carboxylesterase
VTRPPLPPGHRWAEGPAGPVEYLVTGSGVPVTLFVHGLTGSIAQTRPFGSGVTGSRVFLHLRGHGATPVPSGADGEPVPGGYADLAAELTAVATATGATRALGVSLGAGALVRRLADQPDGFDRVVLVLPSALGPAPGAGPVTGTPLDTGTGGMTGTTGLIVTPCVTGTTGALRPVDDPAARLLAMADAALAGDVEALARLLRAHQPAAVRALPAVGLWARRRAAELVGTALPAVLRGFAAGPPPAGPQELSRITCPVLIVAQEGDQAHPVEVASAYAQGLPNARLEVLPAGAVPWNGRDRLRELVAGFLEAADSGDRRRAPASA